jgi:urease accessory protein
LTTAAAIDDSRRVFAANRAIGKIAFTAKADGGVTRRAHVHEHGALRARFPATHSADLEAVIVNTAGGMTGGDRFDIDIAVAEDARLVVTTTAAEKIYRSLGPDATVDVTLKVSPGGMLAWLPQETILFDRARLRRSIKVELVGNARLILAEAIVFGRTDMGEAVTWGRLSDCWRIRRDGRLIHAEMAGIDGNIAELLAKPAAGNGGVAIGAVLTSPGDETAADRVRALAGALRGEVGVSSWNGIAVVRLCAAHGAQLRHDLAKVLTMLRGSALPRLWMN